MLHGDRIGCEGEDGGWSVEGEERREDGVCDIEEERVRGGDERGERGGSLEWMQPHRTGLIPHRDQHLTRAQLVLLNTNGDESETGASVERVKDGCRCSVGERMAVCRRSALGGTS